MSLALRRAAPLIERRAGRYELGRERPAELCEIFHKVSRKGWNCAPWWRIHSICVTPILIAAGNPGPLTGSGNNTWLLEGAEPTLIDAGVGAESHLAALESALRGRELARVLVTHGHSDHASGLSALRGRWPRLEAHKFRLDQDDSVWQPLSDGDVIAAGDAALHVIHTPGHAPDHVCFWDADRANLFAGDMVVKGTTVMIPAGRGGNLRDYLASLDRLAKLGAGKIFPGHGPVIDDPAAIISEYKQHRRLRDHQIRACLDAGVVEIDAIVVKIYPDLAESLKPAARLTVQAHLEKIRDERPH